MAFNYSPKIVVDGLVLYLDAANSRSYPGSGTTWSDISRGGNNGTLTNGPTYSSANGGSIVFDGSNDTAVINDATSLNFGTGDFSVGCFLYVPTSSLTANKEYGIIDKNTNFQNSAGWGFEVTTYGSIAPYDNIGLIFYNTGQTGWGNANVYYALFATNRWNYVVATRVLTTGSLYLNGILVGQKIHNQMSSSVNNNTNIILGKNGWGVHSRCQIASVTLHNKALSAQEILQNYNAHKSRYGLT